MLWTALLGAQPAGNPFDLEYRKPVARETPVPVTPPGDSLPGMPAQPEVLAAPVDTQIPPVMDTIGAQAPSADSSAPASEDNPFAIDRDAATVAELPPADAATPSKPRIPLLTRPERGLQISILLLSVLLLIFIVNVEQGYVRDMWRVISNENYSSLQQRNQRSTMRQILTAMGYVVFVLQAGLFLFHALNTFRIPSPVIRSLLMSVALVAGVYLIRHLMLRYLRWLFNRERQLALFAFDITIFNTMVGLIFLPMNVLLLFGPDGMHKPLIITGLIVAGSAYLMRQLRWLVASRSWLSASLLLFFVYLCAVEILPLWAVSAIFW